MTHSNEAGAVFDVGLLDPLDPLEEDLTDLAGDAGGRTPQPDESRVEVGVKWNDAAKFSEHYVSLEQNEQQRVGTFRLRHWG